MHKLNVLVAGSTGYIGIQLIKLLSNHKCVFIKYLCFYVLLIILLIEVQYNLLIQQLLH